MLITNIFAQSNLSDYKYVIVPKKFDFLKKADGYQVNSLTKFLLEKENFKAFFDDNLPAEMDKNRCLALYTDVLDGSGMFKTILKVQLTNCMNEIVFTSQEGISREKEYKKAYHEALRKAFQSFKAIDYTYKPKQTEQEIVEVESVKEAKVEISKPEIPESSQPKIVETPIKEVVIKKEEVNPVKEKLVTQQATPSNILYAQAINNGFQVVDSTPKVVMILLNTSKNDVFIVKGEDAIVYKEDGFWYKSENATSPETLNIKF